MLNKLNSLRNREEGFTLIELLIVVIIIGILAAIALPIFLNQQQAAHRAAVISDVRNTVAQVAVAQFNGADVTAVTPVQSAGDTVTVTGTSDNYTITGTGNGTGTVSGGAAFTVTYSNTGANAGKVVTNA